MSICFFQKSAYKGVIMNAFFNNVQDACAVTMAEEEKSIMVRIPESLLKRVEAVQDEIFSAPDIASLGLRRSRAQAVRILIIKALAGIEDEGQL